MSADVRWNDCCVIWGIKKRRSQCQLHVQSIWQNTILLFYFLTWQNVAWLFVILLSIASRIWRRHQLPIKDYIVKAFALRLCMAFEQEGTFIVPQLMWHGTSGFTVSSMTSKGYGGLLKCHRDLMGPIVKHKVCNSTYIKWITSHSHPIFSLQISLFYFLNCHFIPSYNTKGMFYLFYFCYLSLYGWNIAKMT